MTIRGWTRGQKDSLFTILAPAKDRGNATLKKGREMWTYNPKVNRTIKIPPSMMSQSWMGSDFSNNDLAKSDSILEDYSHRLVGTDSHEGKKVFIIESKPHPQAPVVWGLQRLHIREDHILLAEKFFDEDLHRIEEAYLTSGGEFLVGELDGRIVAMGAFKRHDMESAEVGRMRVHPDFWRRGFGQQMLTTLEQHAR